MKRTHFKSLLVVVSFALLSIGCKASDTASRSDASPAAGSSSNGNSANSNRSLQPGAGNDNTASVPAQAASSTEKKVEGSPELVGTYEAREIRDKGVVTLVSKIKTSWWFGSDLTYSRVSKVAGQTYHSDSGTFRIEKPDKLVLTIQFSREKSTPKIHQPPLQRVHGFSLSPDGEELELTSEKGSVAIFKRIARTKTL